MIDGGIYTVMKRSELKGAPYNPRIIDEVAAKRLRDSIKRTGGLIQPPVWNKRTGNLVAGHQRLEQQDKLEGTPDYQLTVCVVDWPLEKEIEANIALNSPLLQGEYDIESLGELLSSEDIDLHNAGLDLTFLEGEFMNAGLELPEQFQDPDDLAAQQALSEEGMDEAFDDALEAADEADLEEAEQAEIDEIKRRKQAFAEQENFKQQVSTSFRVVCPSDATCEALLRHLSKAFVKTGSGDYIDGMLLAERLGIQDQLQDILEDERPKKKKKAKR